MLQGRKDAAVQHDPAIAPFVHVTPTARMSAEWHGGRAKCLQRLIRLGLPVPTTVALPFPTVSDLAAGRPVDMAAILEPFGPAPLLSVRPSSQDPDWGGPTTVLNIGMNAAKRAELTARLGEDAARAIHLRFVEAYATQVARLDPDAFAGEAQDGAVRRALDAYEAEMGEPFPDDPAEQLHAVLRSMARAWEGTSARLLRQASGAPADAGLGLVVQAMALGLGPGESGSGVVQFVDGVTGEAALRGRYLPQSQARDALAGGGLYIQSDARGPALEDTCEGAVEDLIRYGAICRARLREEMEIEFTLAEGHLSVLDAVRVQRSARAGVRIAVALAEDGIITREEAVMRVSPSSLTELLHPQIDPRVAREEIAMGIAASPGAAWGRLVFSPEEAQTAASRGEPSILVRRETTPEDIRGMHAATGILTERGGTTSHAAVIARGLGLPCVVGASEIRVDEKARRVTVGGRVLEEGHLVTLDGTRGVVIEGQAALLDAAPSGATRVLLNWADKARDIGVRANADTPEDARMARAFEAEGIGLCRTEHMMFEEGRLTILREMIFAEDEAARGAALERLLPMQRADFATIFETMAGKPVCLRLLDPPLHEFLPQSREGLRNLADALGRSLADVTRRARELEEYNPMLGMRGVRLGIAMPEIYDMQARAIFEAAASAMDRGAEVAPEIMIPLVSARGEAEIVQARIEAAAVAVRAETGMAVPFSLGVMVETPRAALVAGELARHADFLSFGTNDLTQMTYGLSRDDAGSFMSAYVRAGVWPEDPFRSLDRTGVGELLTIAAERGRAVRPEVHLSICGEHGGDADSIAFCREIGFDYVSCSPFRVPAARLAAAQIALQDKKGLEKSFVLSRFPEVGKFLRPAAS